MLAVVSRQGADDGDSRPNVAIVGGGIGGLFAANALIAHGFRCRSTSRPRARRDRRRRVPDAEQRAPAAEDRTRPGGGEMGRAGRPDSRYFRHDGAPIAPVQVTDSSGWNATFGMHRADLVEMLAGALPPDVVHTGHRCTAFEQERRLARVSFRQRRRCRSRHRHRRRRHPLRTSALRVSSVSIRCSRAPSPIAAWCRTSAFRIGRPSRWQMWLGKGKHFLTFPVRAGQADQLRRIRSGGRGDEGIVVGARRSRCASPRVCRLGSAHRVSCCSKFRRHSDGRCMIASRCRPGPREG